MIEICRKLSRIELKLTAIEMGKDICIILTGGEVHLGSVTAGSIGMENETIKIKNHKEYVITEMLGDIIKKEYSGSFVICCGIHLDNIIKEEISETTNMCCQMTIDLCSRLNRR